MVYSFVMTRTIFTFLSVCVLADFSQRVTWCEEFSVTFFAILTFSGFCPFVGWPISESHDVRNSVTFFSSDARTAECKSCSDFVSRRNGDYERQTPIDNQSRNGEDKHLDIQSHDENNNIHQHILHNFSTMWDH
jgi:hypothetical protein